MFKKLLNSITTKTTTKSTTVTIPHSNSYTITVPTSAAAIPQNNLNNVGIITNISNGGQSGAVSNAWVTSNANMAGVGVGFGSFIVNTAPDYIVKFSNSGSEVVKLNMDGTVTWANGIDIDEAADAFSKSISLGAEMRAGITQSTKLRMRDSVFEDLIGIAREKGSLTAEDLTYLLEASKIVEKLKGGN